MDVEGDGGSFAHGHGRVAGHAGEVAAAVGVDRRDGQVAAGRHPLPVRQHLLFEQKKQRRESLGRGAGRGRSKKKRRSRVDGEGRRGREKEGFGRCQGRNKRELLT